VLMMVRVSSCGFGDFMVGQSFFPRAGCSPGHLRQLREFIITSPVVIATSGELVMFICARLGIYIYPAIISVGEKLSSREFNET
jgi:hypothetical protein